jgi:hypothetical protein
MEAINVRPFMECLHKALSEALDGPIVRFPTGVVDWDMMVDNPFSDNVPIPDGKV